MPNTINPRPGQPILQQFEKIGITPRSPAWYWLQDVLPRVDKVLTNKGEVQAQANVTGRAEPIGTTVSQLTVAGQLASTDQIAADGAGSPLTGGKRGFQALDVNNRLQGSSHNNALNISNAPTSSTGLSNDGVHTSITIAAVTVQFGDTTVSYNSGSVDPGVFGGPYFIYALDPTRAGGAVTYLFTTNPFTTVGNDGYVFFGSITTVMGTGKTGGGFSGGTGGSGGGRGYKSS